MVQRAYRRQGIASRLLAESHRWLQARGIEHVTLYTAVANQAALSFYARHGMVPLQTVLVAHIG
jgi:ribosomal protein S18 acetylase RimI-like enzyme